MFYVNGNPILATDTEVIHELRNQLALQGKQLFSSIKTGPKNLQVTCPIHNEGQERRPSCGISTVNQKDTPAGTVHCFTCGYTATLEEMISNCFGRNDFGEFGKQWLLKNFLTVAVEQRKEIEFDVQRNPFVEHTYVSEQELDSYRYYHEYMYKRKLTDEVIALFDVGYDRRFALEDKEGQRKVYRCLTFPVRDSQGRTLFVARRSVDTKFFHYPEGVEKPVYGLYELPKDATEVIVCESIINALTCYVYGRPAVALLGLGTDKQFKQLKRLPVRKIILGLDGDTAGDAASANLLVQLSGTKLITKLKIPAGKDINDLTKEEFEALPELLSF